MKTFVALMMLIVVGAEKINNARFALYEVYIPNRELATQLKAFGQFCHAVFTNPVRFTGLKNPVRMLVPEKMEEIFGEFLMCRGMNFDVIVNGSVSQHKLPDLKTEYNTKVRRGNINFEKYHRFDVIRSYLQSLAQKYPKIATVEKFGTSDEGRDLIALKISTGGNVTKPMIFIDAGIHANEWIAPAQALYVIQQLVQNEHYTNLIKNVDWVIFPVVNPDGYEFTLSVTPKFRKTRSKGVNCIGVDPNRNFDFFWGFGGSSNECSEIYPGRMPFSEPETRAIRDLILKYSRRIKLYISFHASSQLILYPWSHTITPPSNADELSYLGRRAASAIEEVSGTHYGVGQIPELLYFASGDSISWARGVAGINLSYVIELPPKRAHPALPLSCIKFVLLEVFQGIKVFHRHVENKHGIS